MAEKNELPSANLGSIQRLESQILFEDDAMIVLNKPSGMAVHGGSGLPVLASSKGCVLCAPEARFLELVHRLDRDTSGVLLVAKKRSALRSLHEQLRVKTMRKQYLALVRGQWQPHVKVVNAPLRKMICNPASGWCGSAAMANPPRPGSGLPVSLPRPPGRVQSHHWPYSPDPCPHPARRPSHRLR